MSFFLLRQDTLRVEKKMGNHIFTLLLIFLLGKYSFSAQENVYLIPAPPTASISEKAHEHGTTLTMNLAEHLYMVPIQEEKSSTREQGFLSVHPKVAPLHAS